MNKKFVRSRDSESGYALVMAIMILAILMITGLMSSSTSITDIEIAKNTVIQSQNASAAESAAMTGVQGLENENDADKLQSFYNPDDWINADPNDPEASSTDKQAKWVYVNIDMTTKRKDASRPRYRAIGWIAPRDTSVGMYAPSLKESRVVGEYDSSRYGIYRVEMGFKKRF